jgi:hypothetical protein
LGKRALITIIQCGRVSHGEKAKRVNLENDLSGLPAVCGCIPAALHKELSALSAQRVGGPNIYFTIGKGMMPLCAVSRSLRSKRPGGVSALRACFAVSGTSFLGVYFLETIAFSFFLYARIGSWRFIPRSLPFLRCRFLRRSSSAA